MEKQPPNIDSRLRHILRMPQEIYQASGIIVNGRRLKSFVFTTDLAIIRNCDADAVFAVYPFTPQQAISDAIIKYSYVPVSPAASAAARRAGLRTVQLARDVESQGAMGVVLDAPINNLNLRAVSGVIDRSDRHHRDKIRHGLRGAHRGWSLHSEHRSRCADTGAGTGGPQGPAGRAHHRNGRQDRREYPAHHRGRCKRHHLYAAVDV